MNYITTIILIGISFFLSFFYTSPMISEISALGQEKATLNNYLGESKNLSTVLTEKEIIYNSFSEEEISDINKLLPDSIDNVKLIIDIDDIASRYDIKIRNIELKAERPGDTETSSNDYGTAVLRFTVSTTYDRFIPFMADLENSLRLVDISALSFTTGTKDITEYNIELKTYWLKETI